MMSLEQLEELRRLLDLYFAESDTTDQACRHIDAVVEELDADILLKKAVR